MDILNSVMYLRRIYDIVPDISEGKGFANDFFVTKEHVHYKTVGVWRYFVIRL